MAKMTKDVWLWLAIGMAPVVYADHSRRSEVDLTIDSGSLTERGCYFEGQRYSEGTVLKDAGGAIRCGVLDDVTQNGELGWLREGEGRGDVQIEQREESGSRVIEIRK